MLKTIQNRPHRLSIIIGFFLLTSLSLPPMAWGHPVSFQGATSLMSYNMNNENEAMLTYSVKHYLAAGLTYYQIKNQNVGDGNWVTYTVPRLNWLAKRWNKEDSQANIYFSGGYGSEHSFNENVGVGLVAAEADWESRLYYISSSYSRYLRQNDNEGRRPDYENIKLRAGMAPYLADFNELNSWLILQAVKKNDEPVELTQFVRMFYRNVMIELGASFSGGWGFNYMVHF